MNKSYQQIKNIDIDPMMLNNIIESHEKTHNEEMKGVCDLVSGNIYHKIVELLINTPHLLQKDSKIYIQVPMHIHNFILENTNMFYMLLREHVDKHLLKHNIQLNKIIHFIHPLDDDSFKNDPCSFCGICLLIRYILTKLDSTRTMHFLVSMRKI